MEETLEPIAYVAADHEFFERYAYSGAVEVEVYEDFDEMVSGASAVILGQVEDVIYTRSVGESEEDTTDYVGWQVTVNRVIAGDLPTKFGDQIIIEFVGQAENIIDVETTTQPALMFVHRKGDPFMGRPGQASSSESDFYRLTSSQGLFVQGPQGVVNPMWRDEPPEAVGPAESGSGAMTTPHPERGELVVERMESNATLAQLVDQIDQNASK